MCVLVVMVVFGLRFVILVLVLFVSSWMLFLKCFVRLMVVFVVVMVVLVWVC